MFPYFQILFCSIIWGFSGPLIKWSGLPPWSVTSLRFTIPLFVAYAWVRWGEGERLRPINRRLVAVSVITAAANALFIACFSFTSISKALLLLYSRPVLATLGASLLLHEHVSKRLWGFLALSFCGVLLIMSSRDLRLGNTDLIGMMLALGAAAANAVGWAIVKKHGYGGHSPGEIVFYQHLFGAVIIFPLFLSVVFSEPASQLGIASLYAVLVGSVATLLYFAGLKHIPLSRAMPLTYVELVIAVSLGIIFFDEELSLRTVLGGLLILTSAAGSMLFPAKRRKEIEEAPAPAE
jgi:drug/metabolite transporter (DMT)-like permease